MNKERGVILTANTYCEDQSNMTDGVKNIRPERWSPVPRKDQSWQGTQKLPEEKMSSSWRPPRYIFVLK